jgi:hypothetical protein
MPRTPLHALTQFHDDGCYVLSIRNHVEQRFRPTNEEAWQAWLRTVTSFAFHGTSGSLNVYREARARGGRYWYAYHTAGGRTRKRYLGRTATVSFARLEEVAQAPAIGPKPAPLTPTHTEREAESGAGAALSGASREAEAPVMLPLARVWYWLAIGDLARAARWRAGCAPIWMWVRRWNGPSRHSSTRYRARRPIPRHCPTPLSRGSSQPSRRRSTTDGRPLQRSFLLPHLRSSNRSPGARGKCYGISRTVRRIRKSPLPWRSPSRRSRNTSAICSASSVCKAGRRPLRALACARSRIFPALSVFLPTSRTIPRQKYSLL